jgi:hypothetical protein
LAAFWIAGSAGIVSSSSEVDSSQTGGADAPVDLEKLPFDPMEVGEDDLPFTQSDVR